MLAIIVIIGSTAAVSATRSVTDTGIWYYGANVLTGTYSTYLDYMHNWWSATVITPSGTTATGHVTDGEAAAKRNYWLLGSNTAWYNFGN